jgi:hypothetical protein
VALEVIKWGVDNRVFDDKLLHCHLFISVGYLKITRGL